MDPTPSTPTTHRRRRSSGMSSAQHIPTAAPDSRRSSQYGSPSYHRRRTSSGLSNLDGSFLDASIISNLPTNGLGNLEDELADVWDGDEGIDDSQIDKEASRFDYETTFDPDKIRDSGIDVSSNPPDTPTSKTRTASQGESYPTSPLSPSTRSPNKARKHRHSRSRSLYDGGGDHSAGMATEDLPAPLKATMADVEGLVKQAPSSDDQTIPRMLESLRNLGNQGTLENGATRLATAHTALSSHLAHQTRLLQSLAYNFVSSVSWGFSGPDDEDIEDLLPLVAATIEALPQPTLNALQAMGNLNAGTKDMISSLHSLSDSLHMNRQVSEAANRRLRSAREVVAEITREELLAEQGKRYLDGGSWDTKLRERRCAEECRDVVQGFEDLCNGWREKLVQSMGEGGAVAAS